MQCPRHPDKNTVTACKDCGAEFCIECIKESDQSNYCPDCYRRKLKEVTEKYSSGMAEEEAREKPVTPQEEPLPTREDKVSALTGDQEQAEEEVVGTKPRRKTFLGRRKQVKKKEQEETVEPVLAEEVEGGEKDFLAKGPDEDFSILQKGEKKEKKTRRKARRKKAAAAPVEEKAEAPADEGEVTAAKEAPDSDEDLLQDVVSTLLKPDAAGAGAAAAAAGGAVEQPAERARARREERAERWSFLAQPRLSQYTILADKWWKSAIFIVLMLLLGAVLWAVPNAYLIPVDMEYGIHAVAIGIIIGLLFWWKAGKAHSTKLAIQAALTTLFSLFIGEFLHWFLVIVKHDAFRTIFFDLISFRFIWENGADIMRHTAEAMFPWAFTWILLLPTLVAFVIGYGMPPIPEIFFQIGRALKGESPNKKEAGHGVEG